MSPKAESRLGFTLIELLVVIAIIGILAALLFPALTTSRNSMDNVKCVSNLRQIGAAVNLFCNDHDDYFPGPLWYGQTPWYTSVDPASLPSSLEKYLNLAPSQPWGQRANVFVCPAYERAVTIASAPVYCTLQLVLSGSNGASGPRPWGYPNNGSEGLSAYQAVMRRIAIAQYLINGKAVTLAASPAIRDTDKLDYQTGSKPGWYDQLPSKPVHIDHQNTLFFDFHVGPVDPVSHLPK
jgi:prepilin-type N-terminal cleavage/methylation domain-containing protein